MTITVIGAIGISILFLTGTGFLLSALLVIAEKKILNYGPCTIDINQGEKKLTVQGGAPLLLSLSENGIFIPSACGGRGSCAYCKVTVVEGGGVIGPVEEPYLSDDEREKGVRLSCQVKVRNNLKIEIPAELFSVKKYTGILEQKRVLTHDIVELRIRVVEPAAINFIAGQYIQLESREYKGRDAVMRAYSIASSPSQQGYIELNIRLVPDGICTTWVFEHLRERDQVTFSGPYGEFHLSDTEAPIIFIAGGSGMAPIRSILRFMQEQGITRKATYFFGALTQKDLFYHEDLTRMAEELSWFTFIPALSNEPEGPGWQGERGIITEVVAKYVPDTSEYEAYLCGSPGMIQACIQVLTQGGMPQEHIYFDKFA